MLARPSRTARCRTARATPRVDEAFEQLLTGMRDGTVLTRSGTPYKASTIRTYGYAVRDVWKPKIGHLRLHEVRRADVQREVDRLRAAGRSASGLRALVDPLHVLYRRALRDELVSADPTTHLELPAVRRKPIDISTVEDPAALIAALPNEYRALWATALYAGLRRGELRALRWRDVDLDNGVLSVSRGWDDVEGEQATKTKAGERRVPIVAPLRAELILHGLATERSGEALVFGRTPTEPFSTSVVDRDAKAAWKAAGLRPTTLHTGRHGTVSRLIAAGLDAKAVQTYAGHTSITTTFDVYGHLFPTSIDADRAKLDAHLSRGPHADQ